MSKINLLETEQQWRTRAEVALHYHISPRTVGNWMRRRILPYSKTRNLVRFELHRCDRALDRFRIESSPPLLRISAEQPRIWRTKEQIGAHLRISLRSVTNLMRRRVVSYFKIGGVIRFDLSQVDEAFARLRSA